jgi:hypothetical protein
MNSEMEHNYEVSTAKSIQDKVSGSLCKGNPLIGLIFEKFDQK